MNSVTNIHSKLLRNRNTPMYRSPNNIYLFKLGKFEQLIDVDISGDYQLSKVL